MAIKVIVEAVSPSPFPPGNNPINGSVSIHLISDYQSPMPFQITLFSQFENAKSENGAIKQVLDKLEKLTEDIKLGVGNARQDHPVGSA